jgi:hypothetical protein
MTDLTSLANVKSYLSITDVTGDAELQRLLSAYSNFIAQYCNNDFVATTYDVLKSGRDTPIYQTSNYPIISIATLEIDGRPIPAQTAIGAYGYRFGGRTIVLDGALFSRGWGNIHLVYTAGYVVIPLSLQNAVCELAGLRYQERDRIGYNSKSLAGETVSFIVKDMPASVATILRQFTDVLPV